MARQFITGRTGAEAVPVLKKIRARNVGFTVDILGEAVVSEREAQEYYDRYLELIESLAAEAKNWAHSEQLEGGASGEPPDAEGQRFRQDFRAVFADSSGGPGGRDRAPQGTAAAVVPPREGTRRVHQSGHGELRAQEPDA